MLSGCAVPASRQLLGRGYRFKATGSLSKSKATYPDKTQLSRWPHLRVLSAMYHHSPLQYSPTTTDHFVSWRNYAQVASQPSKTSPVKATNDVPPREAFSELKDVNDLKLNQTISLPKLCWEIPGELYCRADDENILNPILLTRQRIKVLQQFFNEMKLSEDDVKVPGKGLILSGPFGQGKSILSYLLACTAYANNCILVYIPHCYDFSCFRPASNFLDTLKRYNSELLRDVPSLHADQNLAAFIAENQKKDPVSTYHSAIRALKRYTHRPVVYILDSHHEIWVIKRVKDKICRDWTVGSGGPHGDRTCVIYSGSAHSRFEANLPANMQNWVVKLEPLADVVVEGESIEIQPNSSFRQFIETASPTSERILGLLQDEKTSASTLTFLFNVTRGNPREISDLLKHLTTNWQPEESLSSATAPWVRERDDRYFSHVMRCSEKCTADPLLSKLKLHNFLRGWFGEQPLLAEPPNELTDTGLIYQVQLPHHLEDVIPSWHGTSLAAYRALHDYYFELKARYLFMDPALSPHVLGLRFKMMILHRLRRGVSMYGWYFGNPNRSVRLTAPRPRRSIEDFELFKKGSIRNETKAAAIYIPTSFNLPFPTWDAVFHEPPQPGHKRHRLVFIQTTMSTPLDHDEDGKIAKSFRSLVPQIVSDITGCTVDINYDSTKSPNFECKSDKVSLIFVVITWNPKDIIKKKKLAHSNFPDNILIVSQEDLWFIPTAESQTPC